jgi:tetratricopeptide (TPR) repeat protein
VGLPLALQAHQRGDLVQAKQHYQRAFEQQVRAAVLYQNYGALLREQGDLSGAAQVYNQGLALFPHHPGILGNRANLHRATRPAAALADNLRALRLLLAEPAGGSGLRTVWLSTLSQLRELQLHAWALALAREGLARLGPDPQLLLQLLLVLDALASASGTELLSAHQAAALRHQIEARLAECAPMEQAEIRLGLASHQMGQGQLDAALASFEQAMAIVQQPGQLTAEEREKRQKLVDVNSWNFGITLLKRQQFERGWRLFEYGLRTPAEGPQRWQRALRKPFSSAELPLWRGESLAGKRLLLLEEQAIGDVMMFVTLVPALLEEVASIGLLLADRLLPIYRRSLQHLGERVQIWSFADVSEGRLKPANYHLQCPIGSICQHRFTDLARYGQHLPLLQAKPEWTEQLRREYLHQGGPAERLIGISWRGGGKGVRIQQKSILPEQFAQLLQPLPGVRFVSLQYGNAGPTVERWRQQGLDVLHDGRVDPLKQMDPWLAQVAACDAVLSVANTTIHGAGGLGLPTLCLLSVHSDWRWLDDPTATRSYWYPSVGIARELPEAGWGEALQRARAWLEAGSPAPALG